jgi:hypothetical protein
MASAVMIAAPISGEKLRWQGKYTNRTLRCAPGGQANMDRKVEDMNGQARPRGKNWRGRDLEKLQVVFIVSSL